MMYFLDNSWAKNKTYHCEKGDYFKLAIHSVFFFKISFIYLLLFSGCFCLTKNESFRIRLQIYHLFCQHDTSSPENKALLHQLKKIEQRTQLYNTHKERKGEMKAEKGVKWEGERERQREGEGGRRNLLLFGLAVGVLVGFGAGVWFGGGGSVSS